MQLRDENQHLVSVLLGLASYRAVFLPSKPARCQYVCQHPDTLVHGGFFISKWIFGMLVETDPVPRQ